MSQRELQPHATQLQAMLDDAAARERALDPGRSFLVNASAGSGKTELLIQRYLKLLARVEEPEQILAITFTKKAAAEMRDRILTELRAAESAPVHEVLSPHKQRTRDLALSALRHGQASGWNLTRQPQRMFLRTIDSLCSSIVRRIPILAHMQADSAPVENADELYQSAAHAALLHAMSAPGELQQAARSLLLHLDNRFTGAIQLLAKMLASRDQWGPIVSDLMSSSAAAMDAFLHEHFAVHLEQLVTDACQRVHDLLNPQISQKIFSLMQYAACNLASTPDRDNPFADCLGWSQLPSSTADDASRWNLVADFLLTQNGELRSPTGINVKIGFPPKDPHKTEMQQLLAKLAKDGEFLDSLRAMRACPAPGYTPQQQNILRSCFLLLRQALVELQLIFARTGQTDFTEVLLAACSALRQDTNGAAVALGANIQHLLVDEMQDTSFAQFELLQALTQSWDGQSQTIFLVGDPKQSIYRFRNAEVALFTHAQWHGIGSISFECISLTKNFRSRRTLVETANGWFAPIFSDADTQQGIEFSPAQFVLEDSPDTQVCWHPRLRNPFEVTAQTSDAMEAEQLCSIIEQVRAQERNTGKRKSIAILLRKRAQAASILQALQKHEVPYHTVDMDKLAEKQPVLDMFALTRALLHAADRTAWLAILRAPWCGLSLQDLHALCGSGEEQFRSSTVLELFEQNMLLLSPDGQIRAQRLAAAMQQAQALLTQERLSMLVESLWHTLGGPACIQPEDHPAIDQFLHLLHMLELEQEPISAARIEEQMQRLYARTPALHENPVEILTLHKAKGLEWDVVLLPGLHKRAQRTDPDLLLWSKEWPADSPAEPRIYLAPIQHATEQNEPTSTWLRRRLRERDTAEMHRLFYVACTRAREQMYLFAEATLKKDGSLFTPRQDALLAVAWPVAQELLSTQAANLGSRAEILSMPERTTEPLSIAAAASPATIPLSNFRRLPADWQPEPIASKEITSGAPQQPWSENTEDTVRLLRPQGSLRARAFGTVLHALLQPLAEILHRNTSPSAQMAAIQGLHRPAELQLLQHGCNPHEAKTEAGRIVRALESIAGDTVGRWILARHPSLDAALPAFEIPLTATLQGQMHSLRLDRMFLGGPTPAYAGTTHLWIVDFKTATHGAQGLEDFLAEQQQIYAPAMQRYAQAVRAAYPHSPAIRLALYYPLLLRCTWWAMDAN
jgi:ATP-dependent helicase/nuclease subunit A